ncbi:MAG: hypothetical protein J7641_05690 [Cyanobacteria bacterium SID2]|nr:hypothetical protein [Cyanobacteria bacterium SID2]
MAMVYLRDADVIEERPTLNDLLDGLNELETIALMRHLVDRDPSLILEIESYLRYNGKLPTRPVKPQTSAPIEIEVKPFRDRVKQIVRNGLYEVESEYCEEDPVETELIEILDEAQGYIDRDESKTALKVLEAITQSYVDEVDDLHDYGIDSEDFLQILDRTWTEALLSAYGRSRPLFNDVAETRSG